MTTLTINRLQPFLAAVAVAGFAVALGAYLSWFAVLGVDHHFRPEPTIPDPGRLPVADASIKFEPTLVIPWAITLRVRSVDQERFGRTLRKDILAHGGWTDSTGAVTRVTPEFSAITPECYLDTRAACLLPCRTLWCSEVSGHRANPKIGSSDAG